MDDGDNLKEQVTYLRLLPRFTERQQSFKDIGFGTIDGVQFLEPEDKEEVAGR